MFKSLLAIISLVAECCFINKAFGKIFDAFLATTLVDDYCCCCAPSRSRFILSRDVFVLSVSCYLKIENFYEKRLTACNI